MQKLKKTISTFMALVLLLLSFPEFYSGSAKVEATGDPNIINFMDIRLEGFNKTTPWEPAMGNIGSLSLNMPAMTLTNITFDLTTRILRYDYVPDAPVVLTSGYINWYYDTQRTRFLNIYSYMYRTDGSGNTDYATDASWRIEEMPPVKSSDSLQFNLDRNTTAFYESYAYPAKYGIPKALRVALRASDAQHQPNEWMNGWHNNVYYDWENIPLVINSAPTLTVTTPSEQQLLNEPGFSGMNLEGYVRDVDNNDLVVSAEIPNVFYKQVNVQQALNNKWFSIPIDVLADGIPPGRHNIIIKVVDPYNYKDEKSLVVNVSYRLRNKSYILINTPIDVSTIYEDYEGDSKYQERYRYDHNPYFFDNSMGIISDSGLWRSERYTSFPYSGLYNATFQARDNPKNDDRFDVYRLWSRDNLSSMTYHVHRKPIALFAAKLAWGSLLLTDSSYDLDHITAVNKGLIAWQWQYKKTDSEIWTDGQPPAQLPSSGQYDIRLRVRDVDGEKGLGVWSDWCVRTVGAAGNLPPVALFSVDPNIVSYRKATTITDKSFDPDNDPLDVYYWTVIKDGWNKVWEHWGGATTPPNIAAFGIGNYQISLQVHDNRGLWSDWYRQNVQVINHPPAAAFNMPAEVYRDTVITMDNLTPDPDEDGDSLAYLWYTKLSNSPYYYAGSNRNQSLTIRDLIAGNGISPQQAISEGWEMRLKATDVPNPSSIGALSSNATRVFTVKNHVPTAAISGPSAVFQYDTRQYTSFDEDGDPSDLASLQYFWKVTDSDGITQWFRTPNIDVNFPESGIYTLEHWVIDQIGDKSNIATLKVNVTKNLAPSMTLITPVGTVTNPSVIDAEIQGDPLIKWNYTDPESDPQEKYRLEFFSKDRLLVKTVENLDTTGQLRQYQLPNHTFNRFEYFTVYGRAYSKLSWSEISNEKTFIIDNPPQPGFTLITDTGRDAAKEPIYRTDLLNIKSKATDLDLPKGDTISHKYDLKSSNGTEGLASTQAEFTKKFTSNGVFTFKQTVTDSLGLYRELSLSITVANRKPTVTITYPTSTDSSKPMIASTLTPIIKWDYQDEDGDEQQRYKVQIINLATGGVKAESGEQNSSVKQWQVPAGILVENEKYAVEVEAFDGYNWSNISARKYFMVNLLSIKGGVQHTEEWNNNRKGYNLNKSGNEESPRGYNVFWAGERFILEGTATGLPDTVEVAMTGGYSTQLNPTNSDKTLWTGELYDPAFVKLPDGPVTFTFTAKNEYNTKIDTVTVVIAGDWSEYFRNHRVK
ncbi:hypothetical protein [Paenibacillus odorifer]|uniref:Ig-like domain-containing protein n=1 Tax=Paenibacillus odorifer TaxID=189426 RepID=A0AAD0KFK8_9BACL|nr:hypothetical protein [Paenibacillus odorifer]AWV32182.1 hypothetical protein CD191_05870 [Paenibacillus odorifer]